MGSRGQQEPSCWGERWTAIVSPLSWKCGAICLAWGPGTVGTRFIREPGQEESSKELKGWYREWEGGERACFVGKQAEGMGAKDCMNLCDQRKDFLFLFHQEVHLLSGLQYMTCSRAEISKANTGSSSLSMIKQERCIKLPKVSD